MDRVDVALVALEITATVKNLYNRSTFLGSRQKIILGN
jgi:hypothetical protein